jgi:DNA-binding NtrC family response regulator/GGDEF domain-containing protein
MPGGLNEALLAIDADSGEILDCNEGAASLLGVASVAVRGELWSRAITCSAGSGGVLALPMQSCQRVSLPPFLVRHSDGTEVVLGGMLLPSAPEQNRVVNLLLWKLMDEEQLRVSGAPAPSDTLAVLGVDQLRYDEQWGVQDTERLMTELRSILLEIVRTGDIVSPPSAASVFIVLRDVDIEGARDICMALHSHLRREHAKSKLSRAKMRMCFGLAFRASEGSALATLVAANNALMQVQCSAAGESTCAADDGDYDLIVGRVINSAGIFSASLSHSTTASEELKTTDPVPLSPKVLPSVAPIEKDIEGYVVDNMEGAVDQAFFLAKLDLPVAIIGPAGTGKMYIARIIHEESGGATDSLVSIDCREFRSRGAAHKRLALELSRGEGKTLVFKSPHLLHVEVQLKLARQISSRTLADVSPPQYLPRVKLVALFPEKLEVLMRRGELTEPLASVFAGYPINVPPINDRKQAVLRWAHKILGQEGVLRDRDMKGFTPDAEQAMLQYDWPGNISEMRQCIHDAMEKTDKDWLTPVDLGLFKGIDPDGVPFQPTPKPFLAALHTEDDENDAYLPSALEAVHIALGEAVHNLLALNMIKPLGAWVEDELVLAALDRYRGDMQRTGDFLHTKPRNISRWLPKIAAREDERNGSSLWQKPRRLLREWVRESPRAEEPPLLLIGDKLLAHVTEQCSALSSANRARIVGVSTPTYLKRLREVQDN